MANTCVLRVCSWVLLYTKKNDSWSTWPRVSQGKKHPNVLIQIQNVLHLKLSYWIADWSSKAECQKITIELCRCSLLRLKSSSPFWMGARARTGDRVAKIDQIKCGEGCTVCGPDFFGNSSTMKCLLNYRLRWPISIAWKLKPLQDHRFNDRLYRLWFQIFVIFTTAPFLEKWSNLGLKDAHFGRLCFQVL